MLAAHVSVHVHLQLIPEVLEQDVPHAAFASILATSASKLPRNTCREGSDERFWSLICNETGVKALESDYKSRAVRGCMGAIGKLTGLVSLHLSISELENCSMLQLLHHLNCQSSLQSLNT